MEDTGEESQGEDMREQWNTSFIAEEGRGTGERKYFNKCKNGKSTSYFFRLQGEK